jgi:hypothetical protein
LSLVAYRFAGAAGCACGPSFTVDDGREVDETLLAGMRAYGAGEHLIRPAVARSAALKEKDKDCDKQWELPFAVATSDGWSDDDRVAWARGRKDGTSVFHWPSDDRWERHLEGGRAYRGRPHHARR